MENIQLNQIQYSHIVGIDISKMSIAVSVIETTSMKMQSALFSNDSEGFQKMKKWLKQQGNDCGDDILFCMEHTGIYTRNIVKYLLKRGCKVWFTDNSPWMIALVMVFSFQSNSSSMRDNFFYVE